jgi:quinol monooxygenase YgiN
MFALMVRFHCRDGAAVSGFDKLVAATVEKIREYEPGTLDYTVHRVDGKPLERIFYELYRDRGAFDAHEAQEYVKEFLEARNEFITSFEVDFLDPVVGKRTLG